MVFGKGVIANRFMDYALQSSHVLFAGDIHDSLVWDETALRGEEELLQTTLLNHPLATFVYFSSCSVLDPEKSQTRYVVHKLAMENLVKNSSSRYVIFRLPQIMGLADEKNSLTNYLVEAILKNEPFSIWQKTQLNIIDIDDVHQIVHDILSRGAQFNKTINVANPRKSPVLELVRAMEAYFKRAANYTLIDKGSDPVIDLTETEEVVQRLKIDFGTGYFLRSIDKYYRHLLQKTRLLSVVVPTYNEEHGIEEFYRRTKAVLVTLSPRFDHEIIFVNDFSTDNTYAKLQEIAKHDVSVKLINFSRNFGNQMGITAGIDFSRGEIAVIIDDDLQDPPEVILNLIALWSSGYKVVYGVRPRRQGVNPVYRLVAKFYYRLIRGLSETKIPNDTGDFRLIDRLVIDNLRLMKEENRYYRGMVAWVGFPQIGCFYERDKRYAGVSTFSIAKYINFALNGLTSFTDRPLYFSSMAGFIITVVGFLLASTLVIYKIINPQTSIPGWTSLMALTVFFGGLQLFSIGIVAVYISKIYREVKARPLYIIESTSNLDAKSV